MVGVCGVRVVCAGLCRAEAEWETLEGGCRQKIGGCRKNRGAHMHATLNTTVLVTLPHLLWALVSRERKCKMN